jgi:hypothetical protein
MSQCKWKICRWFFCALLGCCLIQPVAMAGEEKASTGDPSQDEMMAAITKLATPGPHHESLEQMVGNWKTITKTWQGPGDPQVSEGKTVNKAVLGGRFIEMTYKGDYMGQPFEGFGLTGYDNQAKKVVTVWADTMSTAMTLSRGTLDTSGKVITMEGTYANPETGKDEPYRTVTRIVDNNKHLFEMYTFHGGKELKEMEITYIRQ